MNGYQETSFNRINDISYNTYEGFVQDSWKVSRRLTLELGLRATHFQPWIDRLGYGYSIFDYSKYSSSCTPTAVLRLRVEQARPDGSARRIPDQGAVLAAALRRGLRHRRQRQDGSPRRMGPLLLPFRPVHRRAGRVRRRGLASVSATTSTAYPLLARELDTLNVADQASSPAAVDSKDDRQPYTDSYSFTDFAAIAVVESARSGVRRQPEQGSADHSGAGSNINLVPVGAMLSSKNGGVDPNSLTADNFRPLKGFSDLPLATNRAYANYNALQVTWVRTKGRYTINMNYTYGKAMGIVNTDPGSVQPRQQLWRAAGQPHAHLQRRVLHRVGRPVHGTRSPAASSTAGSSPASRRWQSGANLSGFSINNNVTSA